MGQETAALRDFNPTYDRLKSSSDQRAMSGSSALCLDKQT